MAKSSLDFTCTECGSAFTISKFFHSREEANSWEEYSKNDGMKGICPACRRKFAIEERDKKNAEIIEEMGKMYNSVFKNPLPQLEGTEKQVKWAESIRAKIYIFAFRAFNLKSASRFILALNEYTDSTFWIDLNDALQMSPQKALEAGIKKWTEDHKK